ncbi:MAG: hypothetical protein WCQ95_13130 [Bacteroidota bacterium]
MDELQRKKKKENLTISLICFVAPLLGMGIWMLLSPAQPEHQAIERSSVYFVKSIWGIPTGATLLVFDVFVLLFTLLNYKKAPKAKSPLLSNLIYSLSRPVLMYTLILYAIVLLQNQLAQRGILPSTLAYQDISTLKLAFTTIIVVVGLLTLGFGLACKFGKK